MKFKGAIKDKIIPIVLFIIAAIIVVLIMKNAAATREVTKVPVLKRDYLIGMKILPEDIVMKEVGKHNLDKSILKSEEELAGSYALNTIKKDRLLYKDDISLAKTKSSILYDIKYGAVSVNTNLVKSVGGLPKAGDWVQVKLIKQNPQTRTVEVLSYAELEAVKLISIQDQAGDKVEHTNDAEKNGGILAADAQTKPALATFDAKPEQIEALLEGEYAGQLHMVMLPEDQQDDEFQKSLFEERLKRAIERKQEQEKQVVPPVATPQTGGESNEIRQ